MRKNIKINNAEPCLCGSGKTFKQCCKRKIFSSSNGYSEDVLNNPQRINAILQERMDKTDFKVCMYPDKSNCKLPIKNAHTLQNNGVLSVLAEDNHVMVTDVLNKVRTGSTIKRISKNKATTFYGFCEYHDTFLFKDIEVKEYNNESKQNFLYSYRIVAQEYHKKQRSISSLQNCVKDNPSILQNPVVVEQYRMNKLSVKDLEEYMIIFNDAYMNQNFEILYNYVYKFEYQLQFAVTTMYVPCARINGEKLIDIYSKDEERLQSVFLTIIPANGCSYFIMSCLKKDYEKLKPYFDDVENFDEIRVKRFLNWNLPTYSENIVLSPKLWNQWNKKAQNEYEKIIAGPMGDFEKILNYENPFDSEEEFLKAFMIGCGYIDMQSDSKYDLFLQ